MHARCIDDSTGPRFPSASWPLAYCDIVLAALHSHFMKPTFAGRLARSLAMYPARRRSRSPSLALAAARIRSSLRSLTMDPARRRRSRRHGSSVGGLNVGGVGTGLHGDAKEVVVEEDSGEMERTPESFVADSQITSNFVTPELQELMRDGDGAGFLAAGHFCMRLLSSHPSGPRSMEPCVLAVLAMLSLWAHACGLLNRRHCRPRDVGLQSFSSNITISYCRQRMPANGQSISKNYKDLLQRMSVFHAN